LQKARIGVIKMVKFYYPPAALLPQASSESVELAGAKCIIAIDEERQFYNIMNIFNEKSLGIFWKEAAISDQIEHLKIISEDAEALYDPSVLEERIVKVINKVINQGLILFGVANFEGNAFESTVPFEEFNSLSEEDSQKLTNLHKVSRMRNAFPDVKQGKFVEINFFGKANKLFLFPNKKNIHEIASMMYPYKGNATGIVAVAQGAANFIILTSNMFGKSSDIQIDQEILEQMFKLLKKDVLKSPISWFKFDLGLKGLEKLEGWNEIKGNKKVKEAIQKYKNYLQGLIVERSEKTPLEKILEEDLGKPIRIEDIPKDRIEEDMDHLIFVLNKLNEAQITGEEISLLYDPPRFFFQYSNTKQAAIGGGMYLLSIDVGKNIACISKLREDISWGEYYRDEKSDTIYHDTYFNLKQEDDYFELKDATQLRDIFKKTIQEIIQGSELFLGTLELESNAFEFSLFRELDLKDEHIEKIKDIYQNKIREGRYPKLEDRHIKIKWIGEGRDLFINPECIGILDLAEKIRNSKAYEKKYIAGVVCADSKSTYFYILTNNISEGPEEQNIDKDTLNKLFSDLENTNIIPICWFKITLGLESLQIHPYWNGAYQYDTLRRVIDNYNKYIDNLVKIYEKEKKYRLY